MKRLLLAGTIALWPLPSSAIAQINCYGTTVLPDGSTGFYALQYKNTPPKTWYCVIIPTGTPGPPGPSVPADNTGCLTARWDGVQWVCVPTNYLTQ